jgi:ribose transport system ATP-binding protein
VDFDIRPGEVHALVGENGAGKSTLMKILGGYQPPSGGTIAIDGQPTPLHDCGQAEALGIVMIHQEFNLADHMTVEENIFLGRELGRHGFLDRRTMQARSRAVLTELECLVDPLARINSLTVSEKQMVEIAKAVSREVRVLIMDEPTAVLTGSETEVLFRLIRRLTEQGVGIAYISHKLNEIKTIADRITVLRDGRLIGTYPAAELTQDDIARLMVGREISDMYPPKLEPAADAGLALAVNGVTVPGWVAEASFTLRHGEIVGFAGLVGSGRTELMEGILGLRRRSGGVVRRDGRPVTLRDLGDATREGIAYLTEDRKGKGLLVEKTAEPNLTLLALGHFGRVFIDRDREHAALDKAIGDYEIRINSREVPVASLSGGNQQKLLLAKTMLIEPAVLIVDEPTRGIDVGTKRQIYLFLHDFARRGGAVILISSEMPEIIGLSHRVVVMHDGAITGILSGADIQENEIVRYATGLKGARQNVAVVPH